MTATVTINSPILSTYEAKQGNTTYVFGEQAYVTSTGNAALTTPGDAKNRSFEVNGTLDGVGGCGRSSAISLAKRARVTLRWAPLAL